MSHNALFCYFALKKPVSSSLARSQHLFKYIFQVCNSQLTAEHIFTFFSSLTSVFLLTVYFL